MPVARRCPGNPPIPVPLPDVYCPEPFRKQIQIAKNAKRLLPRDGWFCFENSVFGHWIFFRISDFVLQILVQKQGVQRYC
jgi:hypothetical protein